MHEPQPPQSAEPPPEQSYYLPYSSQPPYAQQSFPGSSPQPPPYGYYPPPAYGAPVYAPPTSTNAIVSLACSIASWLVLPFIGAVVGIVFGHIARREIRNSKGTIKGDGLAIAGLVIGYLHIAFAIVAVLFFVLLALAFASDGFRTSALTGQATFVLSMTSR